MQTLDDLSRADLARLERLYTAAERVTLPSGCFRGHHLAWTGSRYGGARRHRLLWRPLLTAGFVCSPFGVDFDRRLWFFWDRRLAVGRFEARIGPSRWRETETVTLRYHVSRLPGPIRGVLYDEVKPLSASLCLGLGGLDGPRGEGDLFFFALERMGRGEPR